jgi:hypothetical protein
MTIVMKTRYAFTKVEIDAMQRRLDYELGLAPSDDSSYPTDDVIKPMDPEQLLPLPSIEKIDCMALYYQEREMRREIARKKKRKSAPLPRHGFGRLPKHVQRPAAAVPTPAPVKAAAPQPTASSAAVTASDPISVTPRAGWRKPDGGRWKVVDEIPW